MNKSNQKLNKALEFFGRGLKDKPKEMEIVIERLNRLIDDGYTIKPHWDRKGPRPYGKDESFTNDGVDRDGIIDHPYRLIKDGKTVYVAEPYSVCKFGGLHEATKQGWTVDIRPYSSLWYPGWTIAIYFKRVCQ